VKSAVVVESHGDKKELVEHDTVQDGHRFGPEVV
jgi:hypothetical protein